MTQDAHIFGEIPAHVDHRKSVEWNQKHGADSGGSGPVIENPWMKAERLEKELKECRNQQHRHQRKTT